MYEISIAQRWERNGPALEQIAILFILEKNNKNKKK